MTNSASTPAFDPLAVAGYTAGALDLFDYVDGLPKLLAHPRPQRVPLGAPVVGGGWIVDPDGDRPFRTVIVVLDGHRGHATESGLSRADIAAVRPDTPERIGYRAIVPTGDLAPGGHELRAYGLGTDGRWYEAGYRPFWLAPTPKPELASHPGAARVLVDEVIDIGPDGAVAANGRPVAENRFALLSGWAVDPRARSRVAGVVAFDPWNRPWSAPCDVERPDLRGVANAHDDRLGFEIVVPADALGRGRHQLRVNGFDDDGRLFAGSLTVTVDVAGPARAFPPYARRRSAAAGVEAAVAELRRSGKPGAAEKRGPLRAVGEGFEAPLRRGTILAVEGWAVDAGGRAAAEVFLEIDPGCGVPVRRYAALAGFRCERPATVFSKPPVDDGWFSVRLDTGDLAPRTYGLALAVLDASRHTYASRALGTLRIVPRRRKPED